VVDPVNFYFDHHAKFGCRFSYSVRACRSQKIGGRWGRPLRYGRAWDVADPYKHAIRQHVLLYQMSSFAPGQTVWAWVGGHTFLGTLGPRTLA